MTDNKYTADVVLNIQGKDYKLSFPWEAISQMKSDHEDYQDEMIKAIDGHDPKRLAYFVTIGLAKNHPGKLTAEDIFKASPPLEIVERAIHDALAYAFYGPTGKPVEMQKKKMNRIQKQISKLI